MSKHDDRLTELIAHEAASWVLREAGGQSMITVTRALLASHGDRARVFVSIFPPDQTSAALSFLKRSARDFRDHLATHARIRPLPVIEFVLDEGELYRQHLDQLSKKP